MAMWKLLKRLPFIALSRTLLFAVSATGFAAAASAQSSDNAPSVAEAARRAREQKKNAAKPARTVTDDNLPKPATGDVNVTGAPAAGADPGAAQPGVGAGAAKGPAKTGAAPNPADQETLKQKKAQAAAELE